MIQYLSLLFISIPFQFIYLFKIKLTDPYLIRKIIKGTPIVLNILFVFLQSSTHLENMIGFGLICSVIGDTVIEFDSCIKFALGIVSFLSAHIFNAIGFFSNSFHSNFDNSLKTDFDFILKISISCLFGIVLLIFMIHKIKSFHLNKMITIACCVYVSFILLGFISSFVFVLFNEEYSLMFKMICFIGYVNFVISDYILFFNVFDKTTHLRTIICMGTYYCAQELLALGVVLCIHYN